MGNIAFFLQYITSDLKHVMSKGDRHMPVTTDLQFTCVLSTLKGQTYLVFYLLSLQLVSCVTAAVKVHIYFTIGPLILDDFLGNPTNNIINIL